MKCTVLFITWEDAAWSEKCGGTLGSPGLHRANVLKIYLWAEGGRKVT